MFCSRFAWACQWLNVFACSAYYAYTRYVDAYAHRYKGTCIYVAWETVHFDRGIDICDFWDLELCNQCISIILSIYYSFLQWIIFNKFCVIRSSNYISNTLSLNIWKYSDKDMKIVWYLHSILIKLVSVQDVSKLDSKTKCILLT